MRIFYLLAGFGEINGNSIWPKGLGALCINLLIFVNTIFTFIATIYFLVVYSDESPDCEVGLVIDPVFEQADEFLRPLFVMKIALFGIAGACCCCIICCAIPLAICGGIAAAVAAENE